MNEAKVYHVEFYEPVNGKRHYYFGSQAAIYDTFDAITIGISYRALSNQYDLSKQPYENRKCIIRLGELKRKKGNRGKML